MEMLHRLIHLSLAVIQLQMPRCTFITAAFVLRELNNFLLLFTSVHRLCCMALCFQSKLLMASQRNFYTLPIECMGRGGGRNAFS